VNKLTKNQKIGGVVGIVVIIVALAIGNSHNNSTTTQTTQTTVSQSALWQNWKITFDNTLSQTEADYTMTTSDLSNGNTASTNADFAKLAQDAVALTANATSPDPTVNAEIRTVAQDLQSVSSTGIQAIAAGQDTTAFNDACTQFGTDSTTLANSIGADNNIY